MIELYEADLLRKAFSQPPAQRYIKLAGSELNVLEWGEQSRPGLLFVHGGAANANWWSFIAPFFLPEYHCIAIDLSGHGDSARRVNYSPELWREEVLQLAKSPACFQSAPVIIGHSMGGLIGIRAAAIIGNELPGLIIIDSAVRPANAMAGRRRKSQNLLGQKRIYQSRQQILSKFRLIPPQDCQNSQILNYIAAESIRNTNQGWTWKYDPAAFRDLQPSSIFTLLHEITCPALIVRGQGSRILDKETAESMQSELSNASDVVEIANAFHHIMLDQPVLLIEEIKIALKQWNY